MLHPLPKDAPFISELAIRKVMELSVKALHEVLPRFTTPLIDLITESLLIEPNRVFIIPENRDSHVLNGEFRLKPISKSRG